MRHQTATGKSDFGFIYAIEAEVLKVPSNDTSRSIGCGQSDNTTTCLQRWGGKRYELFRRTTNKFYAPLLPAIKVRVPH